MHDFKRLGTIANHTGGAGADELTGGAGEDTFVFEDTAANNGNDTLTFTVAGDDSFGDILDFTAFFDEAAAGTTDVAAAADQALVDSTVFTTTADTDGNDFGGAADFADMFAGTGEPFNTTVGAGGAQSTLIVQDDDGNQASQLYYIDSTLDGNATDITAADVTLVGTSESIDQNTTFAAGDFA